MGTFGGVEPLRPAHAPARTHQDPRTQPHLDHDRGIGERHIIDNRSRKPQKTVEFSSGAHAVPSFGPV